MANIFDYIKKYGDKTFEEKTFNEVDNLIFSSLSYIDYKDILISKKITIQECAKIFFDKYMFILIFAAFGLLFLFSSIRKSRIAAAVNNKFL